MHIDTEKSKCYNFAMKTMSEQANSQLKWLTLKTSVISTSAFHGGSLPKIKKNGLLLC
jgi:hypothetical protein